MSNQEIVNALRNTLKRKQSLEKAKQSFINAGYDVQEVEQAVQEVSQNQPATPTTPQPQNPQQPRPTQTTPLEKTPDSPKQLLQTTPQKPLSPTKEQIESQKPNKLPKKLWIIFIIISILIIGGAAVLGIFWDRLFG